MKIDGRNRTNPTKKNNKDQKINMVLDLRLLDAMCKYSITDSSYVRVPHLINLRKLINLIDPDTYMNDIEKVKRFKFISKAIEAKLDRGIMQSGLVIEYVSVALGDSLDFIDQENFNLSSNEIEWISEVITESLNYSFIYNNIDTMQEIATRFKSTDYRNRGDIVDEFESVIDSIKNDFRKAKVDKVNDMEFSLRDGRFEEMITEAWNAVTNPSRRLLTGMQGFNEMLNGGFESGRSYLILGLSGVGKSICLLNLIYQMKKVNKNYKTKDPTKIPCIVLLTMENSIIETLTRLFDLATDGNGNMASYPLQEVIHKLRTEGQLKLNDDSPIDIVIKFKPNKSVDTSYLYTLADDLEDQGYEPICIVQDHAKRINPVNKNGELRLDLGEVINEFKTFAIERDISVISNSHLNREAAKIVESAANKQDLTRLLGKSNVGESIAMIENVDGAYIINIEYDKDGNKHMIFSCIKNREKNSRQYIAQPYVQGSEIRLVEDIYSPVPLFKESLHTPMGLVTDNTRPNIKRSAYSDISSLEDIITPDNDNIFDRGTKYSSLPLEEVEYDGSFIPEVIGKPSTPIVKQKIVPIRFF